MTGAEASHVNSAAEELRQAAELMRERAELVPPPPWFPAIHDVTTTNGLDVIASSGLTVRAQYVASWHPGVATAVASWLDVEAGILEKGLPDPTGGWAEARAVARAYLGTETP